MLLFVLAASLLLQVTSPPPQLRSAELRTVAIDEAFAERAHLKVGDTVTISSRASADNSQRAAQMGALSGGVEAVVIAAIVRRGADPSEVARGDFLVRMHLDQLQRV